MKNSLIDVNPVDVYEYSMIISLMEELKWIFLCHSSMAVFFFPFEFLGQIPNGTILALICGLGLNRLNFDGEHLGTCA